MRKFTREPKYKILAKAIMEAGGQELVAEKCGVSQPAVWLWVHRNGLPKTDFVGETEYAQTIQNLTKNKYKARTLLDERRAIG